MKKTIILHVKPEREDYVKELFSRIDINTPFIGNTVELNPLTCMGIIQVLINKEIEFFVSYDISKKESEKQMT